MLARSRTLLLAAALAAALTLTGCGGSTPEDAAQPEEDLGPAAVTVTMKDLAFEPAKVEVARGGVVEWVNEDPVEHTVAGEGFESPRLKKGESFKHRFDGMPGTYVYRCTLHATMVGNVVVK